MSRIVLSLSLIFLINLFLHSLSTSAQEAEDEREFDYIEGSKKGPRSWGNIKEEWGACNNGNMQSPIDLSKSHAAGAGSSTQLLLINITYNPTNGILKNRGHDITIQWEGTAGLLHINGSKYSLKQSHWHSPSEHTLDGIRYVMELHMVYASSDFNVKNKYAVVGVLYRFGQPDDFLSKLTQDIASMNDTLEQRNVGLLNPADTKIDGRRYYNYVGSLTVPPCTQDVLWIVVEKVKTVSSEQVDLLRQAVHDHSTLNARPVQPRNRREIHYHGPKPNGPY
ncbi:carbonic anhydrase Nec1 [Ziziphus jujuba]|uniref:Carbonic anhydrase n=1 Tax=Ziziphus jujuba TaxID=326968 RepID=A0ABM3I5A4_ZIZJJ|nr:carbonic anhydrase Nec1 [Ziziphus jujuba]